MLFALFDGAGLAGTPRCVSRMWRTTSLSSVSVWFASGGIFSNIAP